MRYIAFGSLMALVFASLFAGIVSAQSVDAQDMVAVLDHYCGSIDPVDYCGVYQDEVDAAETKASQILNIIKTRPASERTYIIEGLLQKITRAFYTATTPKHKLITAWYYIFFSQELDSGGSIDDLFDSLFDEQPVRSPRSTTPIIVQPQQPVYQPTQPTYSYGGEIQNVWSANRYTKVNSSRKRISMSSRNRSISLGVKAITDSRTTASHRQGYRVVAVIDDDSRYSSRSGTVYGANYESNGSWEITFSSSFVRDGDITIYLLCQNCGAGSTFNEGGSFNGWTIADSVSYQLDNDFDDYDDYDNCRYYNDYKCDRNRRSGDGDLAISRMSYDYDIFSNDVEVTLETTVKNNESYELRLDELTYTVEVDNRRISSSKYDIRHIRTDCDDSYSNSRDGKDIDIEGRDECEITVEFTFDRDDVEDEYVEIEVELESKDDDRSSNNSRDVRFYVN